MADSEYMAVADMAADEWLQQRVAACAAQEQALGAPIDEHPAAWAWIRRLTWASAPGWAAAWQYIQQTDPPPALGEQPTPGWVPYGQRGDVITDGMILATVQQLAPRPPSVPLPVQPTGLR